MKPLLKIIFQTFFFCSVIVNSLLFIFYLIAVFYRFNGMKSLNPIEFLVFGLILVFITMLNFILYKKVYQQ